MVVSGSLAAFSFLTFFFKFFSKIARIFSLFFDSNIIFSNLEWSYDCKL